MITKEGKAGRKIGERWSAILVSSPAASNTESVCAALLGVLTLHEETDDPDGPHTREASKATSERLGAR